MLQKEFSLTVLLTTHSPYFVNAIETYSRRYLSKEVCNYYLTENEGDICQIKDVTQDTNDIYRLLSEPFHQLENERDERGY